MRYIGTLAIAALGFFGLIEPLWAQSKIAVTGFGYVDDLPIYVAQDRGFFAKEGLDVSFQQTPGSIAEIADVKSGKYQIATTSIDNIMAYTEGQADVKVDNFDMFAFAGLDSGVNSVVARPEIKTFQDIKGKTAVVDALTTGYAFLLFRILENHGLQPKTDYNVIGIGTGSARREMMREGKAVVAVMSSPENIRARNEGYNILADTTQALAAYQGSTYSTTRSWAKNHAAEIEAFIRAVAVAHEFIYDHPAESLAVLKNRIPDLSDEDLQTSFNSLVSGNGGLNHNAAMNVEGVRTVLSMRNEFATPKRDLQDPSKYIDLSYYDRAMSGKK